jgi:hypothetical protein
MQFETLLGRVPSTAKSVFAKNLRDKLPEAPKPNFLVWRWASLREAFGFIVLVIALTLPPLFAQNGWFTIPWTVFVLSLEIFAWFHWYKVDPWRAFRKTPKTGLPEYKEAVAMLRGSKNAMERDSILLGNVSGTSWPVLIPFAALIQNAHIYGPIGSYKSWMALLGMEHQVILRGDSVVFHVCLKGDVATMQFLRAAAAAAGLPFRLITIDPGLPSEGYNPLNQSCTPTPGERAAKILQVFGLNTASTAHGESYWQAMSATRAKKQIAAFPECRTFRELDQAAAALGNPGLAKKLECTVQELERGMHVASLFSLLADAPFMNVPTAPQLDVAEFIKQPGVCVLLASANLNKALAATTRRFLLFDVNAAARKHGPDHPPIIFSTDECHEALDSTEMPIFKSCRELRISLWNANQDLQDFQMSNDKNILPMVTGNSRVSICLGVRDAVGRKLIKEMCGDTTGWMRSIDAEGEEGRRETFVPRITTEDFDYVNNVPGAAIVTIHEPEGFAVFRHWFLCQLLGFPCTKEEYEAYRRMPWPDLGGGATALNLNPKPPMSPEVKKEKNEAALAALAKIAEAHRGV